ncbi:hypothetical protein VCHC40A1_3701, partial [Vibrio cholerae HC-40A1]
MLGGGGKQ